MERADKRIRDLELSLYYDAYGAMLTDRQREIFHLYYDEDLSLAEIGGMMSISRQAVSDTLARACRRLRQLEDGLGLVSGKVGKMDGL